MISDDRLAELRVKVLDLQFIAEASGNDALSLRLSLSEAKDVLDEVYDRRRESAQHAAGKETR